MEPTRARPVPFCFQSFLPAPLTSLRFLVACVPARCPARQCFTASQSRSSLTAPKTSSASSREPTFSPLRFTTSIVAIVSSSSVASSQLPVIRLAGSASHLFLRRRLALRSLQRIDRTRATESTALSGRLLGLANHNVAVFRPRHRAFHYQQVLVLVNAQHPQVAGGDAVDAHVSRHAHAFEHAGREGRGANRTRDLEHR